MMSNVYQCLYNKKTGKGTPHSFSALCCVDLNLCSVIVLENGRKNFRVYTSNVTSLLFL